MLFVGERGREGDGDREGVKEGGGGERGCQGSRCWTSFVISDHCSHIFELLATE